MIRPYLGNSRKESVRVACYTLVLALLTVATAFPQANQAAVGGDFRTDVPCSDVTNIDFKNLTFPVGKRIFAFHNGTALNHDVPGAASGAPDWEAEIERDTVVRPTSGVLVRFLLIHDSHVSGSGWRYYLAGYLCSSSGRLQEVFHREGLSLSISRLDSSGITVGLKTMPGKPVTQHWSYTWDRDKSKYVLLSTSSNSTAR